MRIWDNYDEVKPTPKCVYCHGTGLAPGDGVTECGFCDADTVRRRLVRRARALKKLAQQRSEQRSGRLFAVPEEEAS